MAEIRNILRQALAQHQAGQLQAASNLYQQILNSDPNHAEALHLLGVIAIQTSRPQDAIELIERAVSIRRDQACLLYTSPSPRDLSTSRMPSSA